MSHVSQNLAALAFGPSGLTDPLLYHVVNTQQSRALVPGDGVVLCRALQNLTITLPPAATCQGRAFLITMIAQAKLPSGAFAQVTIVSADRSDELNGAPFLVIGTLYGSRLMLSDGQNWWVVQQT